MTQTFDLAEIAYARWKRAVDLLIREVVARRRAQLENDARRRAQAEQIAQNARGVRRVRNLRRIVRRALSEYSRIQIERSR